MQQIWKGNVDFPIYIMPAKCIIFSNPIFVIFATITVFARFFHPMTAKFSVQKSFSPPFQQNKSANWWDLIAVFNLEK